MTSPAHTILIVDDEPEVLESLQRVLRNEPYRVLTTTSPLQALAIIGGPTPIDLLVSDIDMPQMSGLQLVARVRQDHPDVVRVLLTGDARLESAVVAINQGEVHRYLTKPWDTAQLRETLRQALQRLDELRRAAAADRSAVARERLLLELEDEHPGIRSVIKDHDVYIVDVEHLQPLLDTLTVPLLRAALKGT
jgi:DNA-binding NtrC family response regulator